MSKKKTTTKKKPYSTGEARIVSPSPGDVQLNNGQAEIRVWVKPVTGYDGTALVRIIRTPLGGEIELTQRDGDVFYDDVPTGTGTFRIRARAKYTPVTGDPAYSDNDEQGDYNGIAHLRKSSQRRTTKRTSRKTSRRRTK